MKKEPSITLVLLLRLPNYAERDTETGMSRSVMPTDS